MMIGIYRKTSDSKGNIFTSDIMEIDRSLITRWLLNRITVPHFKNRISMMKFVTGLSLLTEPISSDLFGPVDFFYDEHKNVLKKFNLSVDLLDGTTLDIVVDKFNPWSDDFPKTNRKLRDILQEEKQEKLDINTYSSYSSNSEEEGKFIFENIYVDNFITFLSLDYLNSNQNKFLSWFNSNNEQVNYEGDNEEFWVFHLTSSNIENN
ncbi:hypothetical protein OAO52_04645 [Flavobacteriaceae bacterium]|nr:hypothetical protein [Flavobacteriaceae bacterium]